jgi:hypothetical protein
LGSDRTAASISTGTLAIKPVDDKGAVVSSHLGVGMRFSSLGFGLDMLIVFDVNKQYTLPAIYASRV